MKVNNPVQEITHIDARAEPADHVQIEVQEQIGGQTLYVNVNGVTIARISRIKKLDIKADDLTKLAWRDE